jgi:RHS repeat-associated protein
VASQTGIATTSYIVSGLNNDGTYYWRVRAVNAGGSSSWSSARSFHTVGAGVNVVVNGSFEDGTSSWSWYHPDFMSLSIGGPAPGAGSSGGLVQITDEGSENLQLYQAGMVLAPNTQYTLRFKGYSNTGHDVGVYLQKHTAPYTFFGSGWSVDLTTQWQEHTVSFETPTFFDPPQDTASSDDTRLRFWFVDNGVAGDEYHIDDVRLQRTGADTTQPGPQAILAVNPNRVVVTDDELVLFDGSGSIGAQSYSWRVDGIESGESEVLATYFTLAPEERSKLVVVRLIVSDDGVESESEVEIRVTRRPKSQFYLTDHLGTIRSTVLGGEPMLMDDFETEGYFGSVYILPQWTYNYPNPGVGFRVYQGSLTHEGSSEGLLLNASAKQLDDGIFAAKVQVNGTNATTSVVVRYNNGFYYRIQVQADGVKVLKVLPYGSPVQKGVHTFTSGQVPAPWAWHRLKVTAEGRRFTVRWDGQEVISCEDTDSPVLSGKVGFYHPGGGPEYGARWDSMEVTSGVPGQVIAAEDFDPWGLVLEGRSYSYGAPDMRYKFTGKERDAESGYDYFGARYYDARIGRWLSADPLAGKYPSISPYTYAGNSPLVFVDSRGESIDIFYGNEDGEQVSIRYVPNMSLSSEMAKSYPHLNRIVSLLNELYSSGGKDALGSIVASKTAYQLHFGLQLADGQAGLFSRDQIKIANGYSDLPTLAHEVFHAYQSENNVNSESYQSETEAYLFEYAIMGRTLPQKPTDFTSFSYWFNTTLNEEQFDRLSFDRAAYRFKQSPFYDEVQYGKFISNLNQTVLIGKFLPMRRR